MPPVKGKMLNYPEEQMHLAIDAVIRGMPVATAAKNFSVPRITLMYKAKGKTPRNRRMGPDPVLKKEEEDLLVQWIFTMAKAGFPITKDELLDSVAHLIEELKRKNQFLNNRPGKSWYKAFLKRHPSIGIRMAQNLTSSRAKVTETALKKWFQEIDEYLTANGLKTILNYPVRVFNLDETAFFMNPKENKVLAQKGERNVYQQVNADEKDCLTVLISGNANGELAPPLIVFKYARIPQELTESVPKHWGIGKTETGWMTGALFFEFMSNVFHPFLLEKKIPLPVIVFIDGHASHLTLHTSQFCNENGIILVALLPNCTHLIQPMDIAVFHVLKDNWKKKVHQLRVNHMDQPVLRKIHFASLLSETLSECITPSILQNGFRKAGLVPWNPEAVDYSKIPTVIDECQPPIRADTLQDKFAGLEFLEKYIEKEKLASFRCSGDVWEGNVDDKSLFLVWKKIKDDCRSSAADEIDSLENQNNEKGEDILLKDQNQINEEQKGIEMGYTCLSPKNLLGSSLTNVCTTSDVSNSNKSDNKLIPSPFKRVLFWPDNTEKPMKRRNKEKIPSVVTSQLWQEYHQKKKQYKLEQERQKKERAEARRLKKQEGEITKKLKLLQKQQTRRKTAVNKRRMAPLSSDSEEQEEWIESGSSTDDISLIHEESATLDEEDVETSITKTYRKEKTEEGNCKNSYKTNDFVLVSFPGKKKVFKYVCIIQQVFEDGELEVMALKCCSTQKKVFQVDEHDISVISPSQIIEKLPLPLSSVIDDNLRYEFERAVDCAG